MTPGRLIFFPLPAAFGRITLLTRHASDIIAELPPPQSGILTYDVSMPYPILELAGSHGFDVRVLQKLSCTAVPQKKTQ